MRRPYSRQSAIKLMFSPLLIGLKTDRQQVAYGAMSLWEELRGKFQPETQKLMAVITIKLQTFF